MPKTDKKKFDFAGWEKKPYGLTTIVTLANEVNGMAPGTRLQIQKIQGEGAVFICEILTGPQHGGVVRVKATDLE